MRAIDRISRRVTKCKRNLCRLPLWGFTFLRQARILRLKRRSVFSSVPALKPDIQARREGWAVGGQQKNRQQKSRAGVALLFLWETERITSKRDAIGIITAAAKAVS